MNSQSLLFKYFKYRLTQLGKQPALNNTSVRSSHSNLVENLDEAVDEEYFKRFG